MEKELNRRDFLKGLGVATLGTMAFALTGCVKEEENEEKEDNNLTEVKKQKK